MSNMYMTRLYGNGKQISSRRRRTGLGLWDIQLVRRHPEGNSRVTTQQPFDDPLHHLPRRRLPSLSVPHSAIREDTNLEPQSVKGANTSLDSSNSPWIGTPRYGRSSSWANTLLGRGCTSQGYFSRWQACASTGCG